MLSLDEMARFLEEHPRTLAVWPALGELESLPAILSVAELRSAAEIARATSEDELWPIGRAWQDALGVLVRWWFDPGRPRFPSPKRPKSQSATAIASAIELALIWPSIESLVTGTRVGLYEFQSNEDAVSFYFVGDARREALAHLMHPSVLPSLDRAEQEMPEIQAWFNMAGTTTPLAMPDSVFQATLRLAKHLSDQLPRQFDPGLVLPGFTLAEAHALWNVVFGYAYVSRLVTVLRQSSEIALLSPRLDTLVKDLAKRTSISGATVATFVDFLTFRSGRHPDPAVSPFVLLGDTLLISPTLVGMSNFERNLLRLLAYQPQLYGPIGSERGRFGAKRVATYFRTVPGAEVAVNVAVLNAGGSALGDLDVVVVDRGSKRGAILEVKWPVEPDSVEETAKAEIEISKGQEKTRHLRQALVEGRGRAQLPRAWLPFDEIDWDWFVLCGTHQTSNRAILAHAISPVSWYQLWHSPGSSLESIVTALHDEDRLPREGREFDLIWDESSVGRYNVRFQKIRLLG
jgi:hypothetical protein